MERENARTRLEIKIERIPRTRKRTNCQISEFYKKRPNRLYRRHPPRSTRNPTKTQIPREPRKNSPRGPKCSDPFLEIQLSLDNCHRESSWTIRWKNPQLFMLVFQESRWSRNWRQNIPRRSTNQELFQKLPQRFRRQRKGSFLIAYLGRIFS